MKDFIAVVVLVAIVAPAVAAQDKSKAAPAAQQVVKADDFAIAVPAGWRDNFRAPPRFVMFRNGDGIGVPAEDETGEPLQVGVTIERFRTEKSIDDVLADVEKATKSVQQVQLVGEQKREPLKLADGADAALLTSEFIKQGKRRHVQLKLVARSAQANAFIVTAYAIGGRDSTMPTPGSALAKWLRGHVTTFVLDPGKLDETKLPGSFAPDATTP